MAAQTIGQHMLSELLPAEVYQPGQEIDKKSIKNIFGALARNRPDEYGPVVDKAMRLGRDVAMTTGGGSFSINDLRTPPGAALRRQQLTEKLQQTLDTLPPKEQSAAIVKILAEAQRTDKDETYAEADAMGSPLALMLKGAGRGNPASLARLISSDLMYADAQNKPIPVPVLRSYSQGLTPAEYTASTFGARKGIAEAKLSVASGGYLGKLLAGAAHRMVVTGVDADEALEDQTLDRGLPVDTIDTDNIGALLAKDVGPYKRNTVLTPKILADLERKGFGEILVRSPITSADPDGGVYARDVGYRENDRLPDTGSSVGVVASQQLSEPITQSLLSSKHKGGIATEDKGLSGFDLIDKLLNTPAEFRESATYAQQDGLVTKIEAASQGGQYVYVGDQQHWVPPNAKLRVKKGDTLEAGDQINEGIVNPREVIKHKGLGEGARQLTFAIRDAIRDSGMNANRRNIELVTRGLVDRVRVTEEFDDFSPDDIVPYNQVAAHWKPREGHRVSGLQSVAGRYLERPVMHYSIGTRLTPSVVARLQQHGVRQLVTHDTPPPFESEMVRASDLLKSDRDWMTRQIGTGLEKGLLDATHRGLDADEAGTSFVAGRARAVDFNRTGKVKLQLPALTQASALGHQ